MIKKTTATVERFGTVLELPVMVNIPESEVDYSKMSGNPMRGYIRLSDVAKAIKEFVKHFTSEEVSVTSKYYSMGDSIDVVVRADISEGRLSMIRKIVYSFQAGYMDLMSDSYIRTNKNEIVCEDKYIVDFSAKFIYVTKMYA